MMRIVKNTHISTPGGALAVWAVTRAALLVFVFQVTHLPGQVILHDLKYEGNRKWVDGTIYDPQGGKTYRCKVELRSDGTLKVRGFIGISLLGKTQLWTRYTGTAMDLPK